MSNDDGNAIKTQNAPSLPLDLLAPILSHLGFTNRLSTLSKCSQVCRTWYQFSKPHLWRRLWFRSQDRVRLVFTVLGSRPDLCAHVKIIELRVYPLGLPAEELETLEENVGKALRCMWNLEELTWTRTGSLSNRLLPELLFSREKLHTLELTGNTRFYNVDMLWKGDVFPLPNLRNLSFILPDLSAINATIQLAQRTNLRSIMIFCQHTSVFQPVHADLLSESLSHLEKLVLVGCKRLDAESVCKLVKASRSGIRILGLEGCAVVSCAPSPIDCCPFVLSAHRKHHQHPTKFHSIATPLAQTLRTLSLTLPRPAFCSHSEFYTHLGELVSVLDNLTEFTLYAPGGVTADEDTDEDDAQTYALPQAQEQSHSHLVPKLPLSFVRALLTDKRTGVPHCRLTLLRIHGIICSTQSLNVIGTDASPVQDADTGLQDLVLQLESGPTVGFSLLDGV